MSEKEHIRQVLRCVDACLGVTGLLVACVPAAIAIGMTFSGSPDYRYVAAEAGCAVLMASFAAASFVRVARSFR